MSLLRRPGFPAHHQRNVDATSAHAPRAFIDQTVIAIYGRLAAGSVRGERDGPTNLGAWTRGAGECDRRLRRSLAVRSDDGFGELAWLDRFGDGRIRPADRSTALVAVELRERQPAGGDRRQRRTRFELHRNPRNLWRPVRAPVDTARPRFRPSGLGGARRQPRPGRRIIGRSVDGQTTRGMV